MDGTEGCAISNDYGKKMLNFIFIFKQKNMLTTFLPRKRGTQVFKHDQHTSFFQNKACITQKLFKNELPSTSSENPVLHLSHDRAENDFATFCLLASLFFQKLLFPSKYLKRF